MRRNERKVALLYDRFTTAMLDRVLLRSDSVHCKTLSHTLRVQLPASGAPARFNASAGTNCRNLQSQNILKETLGFLFIDGCLRRQDELTNGFSFKLTRASRISSCPILA